MLEVEFIFHNKNPWEESQKKEFGYFDEIMQPEGRRQWEVLCDKFSQKMLKTTSSQLWLDYCFFPDQITSCFISHINKSIISHEHAHSCSFPHACANNIIQENLIKNHQNIKFYRNRKKE